MTEKNILTREDALAMKFRSVCLDYGVHSRFYKSMDALEETNKNSRHIKHVIFEDDFDIENREKMQQKLRFIWDYIASTENITEKDISENTEECTDKVISKAKSISIYYTVFGGTVKYFFEDKEKGEDWRKSYFISLANHMQKAH